MTPGEVTGTATYRPFVVVHPGGFLVPKVLVILRDRALENRAGNKSAVCFTHRLLQLRAGGARAGTQSQCSIAAEEGFWQHHGGSLPS